MEKRALGRSGISISPMVLGGNVFGWTIDEKTSFEVLDAYVDSGLECIDTADVYSGWAHGGVGGQSETIIGNWLKKSRALSKSEFLRYYHTGDAFFFLAIWKNDG